MRRNSWQDGVQETNCPILPGQNWTYSFQVKDQIGSFFYFPSLFLQKAAGGYGAIRVNNRVVIPVPFLRPYKEHDVLIGDWYNADHRDLRASLDVGGTLPKPDGILINGAGPNQTVIDFEPGFVYRLRISNVGLRTSLNFRIQDHWMLLVEVEGSYTVQQYYDSLDIHVGQSYSVLVTANTNQSSFYMIASCLYTSDQLAGVAIIHYPDSQGDPFGPFPPRPDSFDYLPSLWQARSIRWNLSVGAARPNPQGSYHYGSINISRTLVLENGVMEEENRRRYTVNGVSFVHPSTPLKLADYFQFTVPDTPLSASNPLLGTSVIDAPYKDFFHIIFQNPLETLQTWHLDGYNFFVVGMDYGVWNESMMEKYNMVDAISRSTVQVYPLSWTAILVKLDNYGIWNLRSQNAEKWYLGQELYLRVHGKENSPRDVSTRDEAPIPANVIMCGRLLNQTLVH
ncbi:SKU5 similar 18 [Tripterygium wilfordii]|uniref:SKU5 similar 18 n=1 Tax=Tripterygium wilfordii TaxID=458696 RepID=A0A7J7D3F8_TRIWF|nr:SKU5 similar 18 [Tripterygium wilfordii]